MKDVPIFSNNINHYISERFNGWCHDTIFLNCGSPPSKHDFKPENGYIPKYGKPAHKNSNSAEIFASALIKLADSMKVTNTEISVAPSNENQLPRLFLDKYKDIQHFCKVARLEQSEIDILENAGIKVLQDLIDIMQQVIEHPNKDQVNQLTYYIQDIKPVYAAKIINTSKRDPTA